MENSKQKKTNKSKQKKNSSDFVHALRSSGMLLPVSDEEVKSFNELHGELNEELPERFKTLDFIFDNVKNSETSTISLSSEEIRLAYAARDGQEKIPDHILNQMKELKNQAKKKSAKKSKG
jgi:hypothetical protein